MATTLIDQIIQKQQQIAEGIASQPLPYEQYLVQVGIYRGLAQALEMQLQLLQGDDDGNI